MNDEIAKIKYHISILKDNVKMANAASIALELDFSKQQIDRLEEICDKFERQIDDEKTFNVEKFESVLKDEFHIDYHEIKFIIAEFIEHERFTHLAYTYEFTNRSGAREYIKAKYNKFAQGAKWEQDLKKFIDEVIQNSKNPT